MLHVRLFTGILLSVLSFNLFAQPLPRTNTSNNTDSLALVKMNDGSEIQVRNIQFKETAVGQWMGSIPTNRTANLYYTINKSGAQIHNAVPFEKISCFELQKENGIIGFTVILRDGGKIICDLEKQSLTVTDANNKSEIYKCASSYIGDVIISGEKVEDQAYTPDGFIGEAIIDGKNNDWAGGFDDIQKIDFK
jgi:hypothetical protein